MASWARPGVKVVCIVDSIATVNDQGLPGFRQGEILTIADTDWWEPWGIFLSFRERDPHNWGHINGFRPLVSQSDDVALFTHHLDTTKLPERV